MESEVTDGCKLHGASFITLTCEEGLKTTVWFSGM
jgi:hypothetical protein